MTCGELFRAALVTLLSVVGSATDALGQERSVEELVGRVLLMGRDASAPDIEAIGAHANAEALHGLQTIVSTIAAEDQLDAAFRAIRHFANTELEASLIEWLADQVDDTNELRRRGAARALVRFERSAELIPDLLDSITDRVCRGIVLRGLLQRIESERSPDGLELLVSHAIPGTTAARPRLVELFASFDGRRSRRVLRSGLGDDDVSPFVQTVIVDAMFASTENEIPHAIKSMLRADHPSVPYRALHHLLKRGVDDVATFRSDLTKLSRSPDPSVRRATSVLLGRAHSARASREQVLESLAKLARSQASTDRQAAAVLLSDLDDSAAASELYRLLQDSDRSVAAEALAAVERVRRVDSIPALIEDMESASGQPLHDVRGVLRRLTGIDRGPNPAAWRAWWEAEGDSFGLSSIEEARAIELARTEQQPGQTRAAFYGLPVVSEHVVFLLDVSGSMSEKVARTDPSTSAEVPTRLGVAMYELSNVLARLRDGTDANVVFFSDAVYAWSDRLEVLDSTSRANLESFVESQFARGRTDFYSGLEAALRDPRADTVYLLSDGIPSIGPTCDPDTIRIELERWNSTRHVVIHGVAVGDDNDLLESLVTATGGRYLFVE